MSEISVSGNLGKTRLQIRCSSDRKVFRVCSPCLWHNSPGRWTELPPQRRLLAPQTLTPAPSWPHRERHAESAPSRHTWSRWPRAEWWMLMCVLWYWGDSREEKLEPIQLIYVRLLEQYMQAELWGVSGLYRLYKLFFRVNQNTLPEL